MSARKPISRRTKSVLVYAGIAIATAAVAVLCVVVSGLVFEAEEAALYDREAYVSVSLSGAESIGEPLSLPTRLDLFHRCDTEGDERLPLPEELTRKEAAAIGTELWTAVIRAYAQGQSALPSGDDADRLISTAKTTAVLRDFYNNTTKAKIAIWCVQVYGTSVENETYCLSLLLDSLTGQPLSGSAALFDNVREDNATADIEAFVAALGFETEAALAAMHTKGTEYGILVTVPLSDELTLYKACYLDTQTIYTLMRNEGA